jgi:hypothetical protein
MTTKPYELLARFNADGTTAGVTVRTLTVVNGRDFESDPIPLSGATDPAFTQFAQAFSAAVVSERDTLQSQLTAMTIELDSAMSEKATLQSQLDAAMNAVVALQARIDELENPPNPFPNSDWQGFRSAALSSPTIMRMAVSNIGNFMMLLIYMTEMQKDPSTSLKMAQVWNEMETKTPLSPEEIASINSLAANYQVPMVLNSEGQIVIP